MIYHSATLLASYAPSPFAPLWTVEFEDLAGEYRADTAPRFGRSLQQMEGLTVDVVTDTSGTVKCVSPAGHLSTEQLFALFSELP